MAEDKQGDQGFKVVDRRSFAADGSRRESAPGEKKEAGNPTAPPPPQRASTAAPPSLVAQEESDEPSAGFETLVSYLSTTAMFQLGLLAGPSGEKIPSDLENARRTIDLLEVLQQKTHGNLTPEETQLLEDVLYELRMSFVEVGRRQAKKGK